MASACMPDGFYRNWCKGLENADHVAYAHIYCLVWHVHVTVYRNLVIFRVENIWYVIISYSFNFVHSPYRTKHI